MDAMQFGVFTVSDVTPDPTTGQTPSENRRIKDILTIAKHTEEVGLDVSHENGHRSRMAGPCCAWLQ